MCKPCSEFYPPISMHFFKFTTAMCSNGPFSFFHCLSHQFGDIVLAVMLLSPVHRAVFIEFNGIWLTATPKTTWTTTHPHPLPLPGQLMYKKYCGRAAKCIERSHKCIDHVIYLLDNRRSACFFICIASAYLSSTAALAVRFRCDQRSKGSHFSGALF